MRASPSNQTCVHAIKTQLFLEGFITIQERGGSRFYPYCIQNLPRSGSGVDMRGQNDSFWTCADSRLSCIVHIERIFCPLVSPHGFIKQMVKMWHKRIDPSCQMIVVAQIVGIFIVRREPCLTRPTCRGFTHVGHYGHVQTKYRSL